MYAVIILLWKVNKMENKQETKQDEQKQEEPKQEQETKQEEPKKEEQNENLTRIVTDIKTQYENKIEALKDAYGKQIAERDSVIKQLLNGENTAKPETIVDKINKTRNYKKW